MEFVINEWFPEFCHEGASDQDRKIVVDFIDAFLRRQDVIFIKAPSEFLRKLNQYSKQYQRHRDTKYHQLLKIIHNKILTDSTKSSFIQSDINFELELELKLDEGNFNSDRYLFEAAAFTDSKIIVTTDVKLRDQVERIGSFNVILLEDFMSDYLK